MPVPARHKTQDMNLHAVTGIQTLDPRNQVALDLRLRPHSQQDRL